MRYKNKEQTHEVELAALGLVTIGIGLIFGDTFAFDTSKD